MRLISTAVALLALAVPASAADLDARRPRRPPPHVIEAPPAVPLEPYEQVYTRPVVGFYGYPFDYGVPPSRVYRGEPASIEPYVLRRDGPHGVAVE